MRFPTTHAQTAKKIRPIPVTSVTPSQTVDVGQKVDAEPKEFLSFIAGGITQRRPRKVLRLCVILSFASICLTTICNSALMVFLYPLWWLIVISWLFSLVPFIVSIRASVSGSYAYICTTSLSSLVNVCTGIATVCILMTVVEEAVVAASVGEQDVTSYTIYVARNKAVIIALNVLCGVSCLVLSGTVMVYGFFLARRVRRHPPNWLFSLVPSRRSLRSQLSLGNGTGRFSRTVSSAPDLLSLDKQRSI